MKKHTIWLAVGAIVFCVGLGINFIYENKSVAVEAVITGVDTTDTSDGDYRDAYYGTYTVDGETVTDKKLCTLYRSPGEDYAHPVGDTYELRVNPDRPNRKAPEGGVFGVVGLVLVVYHGVMIRRHKRMVKKLTDQNAVVVSPEMTK